MSYLKTSELTSAHVQTKDCSGNVKMFSNVFRVDKGVCNSLCEF